MLDRKGIIGIILPAIVLMVWWYYNNEEMKKLAAVRAQQQTVAAEAAKVAQAEAQKNAPAPAPGATPAATTPAEAAVPEQTEVLSTESVDYTFTTRGAGIAKALLKKHEAEHGTRMTLNQFGDVPIGALTELPGELSKVAFHDAVDRDDGVITFEGSDARGLHLTKKFVVPKSTNLDKDYIVNLRVIFDNRGTEPVTVPGYYVYTGAAAPVHQRDMPTYTGFKYPEGKFVDVLSFSGGWFKKEQSTFTASREGIPWAAVADQYFTSLVTPVVDPENGADPLKQRGNSVWATRFPITDDAWKETGHSTDGSTTPRYGIEGALGMPGFTLAPGQKQVQSFRIYTGPREYGRLRLMSDGEVDVLAFSDFGGLFSFLGPFVGFFSKVLLFSLNSLHAYVYGFAGQNSYAVAIIILTLIIKALLWPMQNKATKAGKRMQALQPKMGEVREKYKDDPTKMNTEVMKLYKEYGVNPLAGCLPAFIQMPIFFGFYNMLGKAVELRNSKFLWVHDLSQPDTLFHIPGFDFPVNILPLFMAGTMVWQMSASPKTGDPTQQKIMMLMPLIFVMFCYNYASALALYLTVNNLVSVVQLYATRNQPLPTLQKRPPPAKRK
ncbi:MAG: membrane protein insertase YidC [Chthoniobacter sp.]|uniref:membrane protein insertase YidC n=1 Tax=Chthoniobacter sp. TaxID=2510640 RepID=UPI0032A90AE9